MCIFYICNQLHCWFWLVAISLLLYLHVHKILLLYSVMNFDIVQIEHWEDSTDFLEQLSRKTGRLLKVQSTSAVGAMNYVQCMYMYSYICTVGWFNADVHEFVRCII